VLWVHASNAARFEQSYRDLADELRIPDRQSPKVNVFKLVHDWLRIEANGRWLLVLDNVDNAQFLLEPQTTGVYSAKHAGATENRSRQPLVAYIPHSQSGSVLITTRTKDAALKLVEESDIVAVKPMEQSQAIALFEKKLGIEDKGSEKKDGVSELATALEFMPLAIIQAAAYIAQRAPRCSVRQYLEQFSQSDREKTSLLNNEAGNLRRDREAKNSIIITWHISFDHIRQIRPSAVSLLSLMSFFDCQGIPEALVRDSGEVKEMRNIPDVKQNRAFRRLKQIFSRHKNSRTSQKEQNEVHLPTGGFEDDVLLLRNYSFISVTEDHLVFEMHALVQLAMRKWLETHKQVEIWQQRFIQNLTGTFPNGEYENWEQCQLLLPHVKVAVVQQPQEKYALLQWASLLYNAAWYE
jgi:hypothetical protein